MPKRVIRTRLSILMLVYEVEFRSSSASYIVIGAIVIFRPPSAPRTLVVGIVPSFDLSARSRRQPTLVYCCINSRRWPHSVVGHRSTYIGRYRVVSHGGRFAGFFGASSEGRPGEASYSVVDHRRRAGQGMVVAWRIAPRPEPRATVLVSIHEIRESAIRGVSKIFFARAGFEAS